MRHTPAPPPSVPLPSPTTPALGELLDNADRAHDRLVGFATILSRMSELHAAMLVSNTQVDFGRVRESEFWRGIRLMMEDIADAASAANAAVEACRLGPEKGGAR